MQLADLVCGSNGDIKLSGELTFNTITSLLAKGEALIAKHANLHIDLGQIQRADSAGIGLLLAWRETALRHKSTLNFINLPKQLLNIARVCGVSDIICKQVGDNG